MYTHIVESFGALTQKQIDEIEKRYNVKLPEDYKNFLMTEGGVDIDYENYHIFPETIEENSEIYNIIPVHSAKHIISAHVIFGYGGNSSKATNIEWYMKEFGDEIDEGMLIIGDALQHGLFVLACDNADENDRGIWYWDDKCRFKCSNEENNAYFVANTFTELMKMVGGEKEEAKEKTKIFEDEFVDLQAEMIWACRDFYDEADKIYAYATNFDCVYYFDFFYVVGNEVKCKEEVYPQKQKQKFSSVPVLRECVDYIKDIEKLCEKYNRKVPTEMRMCYGIKTRKYAADIKYDDLYDVNDLDADETKIFEEWIEEVKQQLKS